MRLTKLDRHELTKAQQTVLEEIEQGPRGKGRKLGLIGPFNALVRAPEVGGPVQALGSAVRYAGSLPENVKEVAICTVGAYYHAKFEFSAHKNLAMKAGVAEAPLNQLQAGDQPDFTGDEMTAYQIASEMLLNHGLSDATYASGIAAFTENRMIELVATIGYYCLISLTLNCFKIPLEQGMEDPFPDRI